MAVRLLLLVAIVAGAAIAAYGLFVDKSGQAIAFATAGLFVMGVALVVSGFMLGTSAIGNGRAGRGGRGVVLAFIGGLCMLGAAGALAGASAFGLIVLF